MHFVERERSSEARVSTRPGVRGELPLLDSCCAAKLQLTRDQ